MPDRPEYKQRWYKQNRERVLAQQASYRQACPDTVARNQRRLYLKHTYNMTVEEYDRLLVAQNFRCAICHCEEWEVVGCHKGIFHVDHDHKTLKVRGLLCNKCNLGLGNFMDSKENLHSAIDYLDRP